MPRATTLALICLGLIAVASLGAPLVAYTVPSTVGSDQALVVLTGSMQPAIDPGDIVFIERVPIDEIQEGDVITFHPHTTDERTYTHRVVGREVDQDGTRGIVLTTKGDANEDPDPTQVHEATLVGRVEHVLPAYGKLVVAMDTKLLPLLLIVVSILTVGFELRGLVGPEPARFGIVEQRPLPSRPVATFEVVDR